MSYIILCNTGSDIISKIETESLEIENYILSGNERNFGPHEILLQQIIIIILFQLFLNYNLKKRRKVTSGMVLIRIKESLSLKGKIYI